MEAMMAKAGDVVHEVTEIKCATVDAPNGQMAGFDLQLADGSETTFCMTFERLGLFVGQALEMAQEHGRARSLERESVPTGIRPAIALIPETLSVSFRQTGGGKVPMLTVVMGDLTLGFVVDRELAETALANIARGFPNKGT